MAIARRTDLVVPLKSCGFIPLWKDFAYANQIPGAVFVNREIGRAAFVTSDVSQQSKPQ